MDRLYDEKSESHIQPRPLYLSQKSVTPNSVCLNTPSLMPSRAHYKQATKTRGQESGVTGQLKPNKLKKPNEPLTNNE